MRISQVLGLLAFCILKFCYGSSQIEEPEMTVWCEDNGEQRIRSLLRDLCDGEVLVMYLRCRNSADMCTHNHFLPASVIKCTDNICMAHLRSKCYLGIYSTSEPIYEGTCNTTTTPTPTTTITTTTPQPNTPPRTALPSTPWSRTTAATLTTQDSTSSGSASRSPTSIAPTQYSSTLPPNSLVTDNSIASTVNMRSSQQTTQLQPNGTATPRLSSATSLLTSQGDNLTSSTTPLSLGGVMDTSSNENQLLIIMLCCLVGLIILMTIVIVVMKRGSRRKPLRQRFGWGKKVITKVMSPPARGDEPDGRYVQPDGRYVQPGGRVCSLGDPMTDMEGVYCSPTQSILPISSSHMESVSTHSGLEMGNTAGVRTTTLFEPGYMRPISDILSVKDDNYSVYSHDYSECSTAMSSVYSCTLPRPLPQPVREPDTLLRGSPPLLLGREHQPKPSPKPRPGQNPVPTPRANQACGVAPSGRPDHLSRVPEDQATPKYQNLTENGRQFSSEQIGGRGNGGRGTQLPPTLMDDGYTSIDHPPRPAVIDTKDYDYAQCGDVHPELCHTNGASVRSGVYSNADATQKGESDAYSHVTGSLPSRARRADRAHRHSYMSITSEDEQHYSTIGSLPTSPNRKQGDYYYVYGYFPEETKQKQITTEI